MLSKPLYQRLALHSRSSCPYLHLPSDRTTGIATTPSPTPVEHLLTLPYATAFFLRSWPQITNLLSTGKHPCSSSNFQVFTPLRCWFRKHASIPKVSCLSLWKSLQILKVFSEAWWASLRLRGSMGRDYSCKNLYSIITREKFLLRRAAIIISCFLYCAAAVWLSTNFKAGGAWLDAGSENKLQDFS